MLRAIAGEHFYQNVVLVTSMWSTMPTEEYDEAHRRERDFRETYTFWGELLQKGAVYYPWDETGNIKDANCAEDIIECCEDKMDAPQLNIILEVDRGTILEDTEAGRILTEELRKRQDKERQKLQSEEQELRHLQEQKAELEAMAARVQNDVRREHRISRRFSISSSSSSSTAMQAASLAYKRREPVVYPSIPNPTRSGGEPFRRYDLVDDVPPPPYGYDERQAERQTERVRTEPVQTEPQTFSAPPPAPLERRYTVGTEYHDTTTHVDRRDRFYSDRVYGSDRSDDERGRRRRDKKKSSRWSGVTSLMRGQSEYSIVRTRR
jgi:hypothetical protein